MLKFQLILNLAYFTLCTVYSMNELIETDELPKRSAYAFYFIVYALFSLVHIYLLSCSEW